MIPFVYYFKDIEEVQGVINVLNRSMARGQDLDLSENFEEKIFEYYNNNR